MEIVSKQLPTEKVPFSEDPAIWDRVGDCAFTEYTGGKKYEKFVQQYKQGFLQNEMSGNARPNEGATGRVQANLTFAHVNVNKAEVFAHEPMLEVEPLDNQGGANPQFEQLVQLGVVESVDDAKRTFADALEDMLTHSYRRCNTNEENAWAIFDCITRGMGVTMESLDSDRQLDRTDRIFRHELHVDPFCRNSIRGGRYAVHTTVKPFHEAYDWLEAKCKFYGIKMPELKPNFSLAEEQSALEQDRARDFASTTGVADCLMFQQMWIRDRDKRVLKIRDPKTKQILLTMPEWPTGRLEVDDFPFSSCIFHAQGVRFNDAFSELEVIEGLRAAYERFVMFLDEKTVRAMAPVLLIDDTVSPEDIKKIKDSKVMEILTVKNLGGQVNKLFSTIDFHTSNNITIETAVMLKQLADEITGLDEILRGAFGHDGMTAREAAIRDEQSKSRTGLKVRAIDTFFNTQARHRAQICRQRVPLETVEKVCGTKARIVWSVVAGSLDDLLSEYSIGVAAGSSSQRAKQERIDRAERLRQSGHEENAAAISVGQPPPVDTLQVWLEEARSDGYRNPERLLAPPPAPPPQQMQQQPAPSPNPAAGPAGAGVAATPAAPAAGPAGAAGVDGVTAMDPAGLPMMQGAA